MADEIIRPPSSRAEVVMATTQAVTAGALIVVLGGLLVHESTTHRRDKQALVAMTEKAAGLQRTVEDQAKAITGLTEERDELKNAPPKIEIREVCEERETPVFGRW